jgi:hypothetical protein
MSWCGTKGNVWPLLPLTEEHLEMLNIDFNDLDEADSEEYTTAEKRMLKILEEFTFEGRSGLEWEKDGDDYYLYSEEHLGDASLAILQEIIYDFDEEKIPYITVEYANVSNRMRPGEHSGGGWFITRKGTRFHNSGSWLNEQARYFEDRWLEDELQFSRLLSEICATQAPFPNELCEAMDMDPAQVKELFERARKRWEAFKEEGA